MDIKKIDIKKKLVAGTALAVMSGFIPPVVNQAQAGTATMPVTVQIVTAVNLANTNGLDFGRLAVVTPTAVVGANHTLSTAGATTTGAGLSVALTGTPGNFDITAGSGAANVNVIYGPAVTYNGGNIVLNRVTLGGVGIVGTVQVAATSTVTAALAGGGNTSVEVGGRLNFVATPTNGNFTGNSATIQIVDIP